MKIDHSSERWWSKSQSEVLFWYRITSPTVDGHFLSFAVTDTAERLKSVSIDSLQVSNETYAWSVCDAANINLILKFLPYTSPMCNQGVHHWGDHGRLNASSQSWGWFEFTRIQFWLKFSVMSYSRVHTQNKISIMKLILPGTKYDLEYLNKKNTVFVTVILK